MIEKKLEQTIINITVRNILGAIFREHPEAVETWISKWLRRHFPDNPERWLDGPRPQSEAPPLSSDTEAKALPKVDICYDCGHASSLHDNTRGDCQADDCHCIKFVPWPFKARGREAIDDSDLKSKKALLFVEHIEEHLEILRAKHGDGEASVVCCKICNKTIDEIFEERASPSEAEPSQPKITDSRLKLLNNAFIRIMKEFVDKHDVGENELYTILKGMTDIALLALIDHIKITNTLWEEQSE